MTITEQMVLDAADLAKREEDLRNEVAQMFADLRAEMGWTQREAAAHTGMSQQNIPRLEKGRQDLKLSTIQKFAHAYGYAVELSLVPLEDTE
jgi:transcriptional regulator with XRE-family HTH domain